MRKCRICGAKGCKPSNHPDAFKVWPKPPTVIQDAFKAWSAPPRPPKR